MSGNPKPDDPKIADLKARMDLWGLNGIGHSGHLVALLRSDAPINPELRKLLADALEGTSEFVRLEIKPPEGVRKDTTLPARLKKWNDRRAIGQEMFVLRGQGVPSKLALHRTATAFGVSEATVEAAFTEWNEWFAKMQAEAEAQDAEIEAAGGFDKWADANGLKERP